MSEIIPHSFIQSLLDGIEGWKKSAACSDAGVDNFFHDEPDLSACNICPVQKECLLYGVLEDMDGVWGGMTEEVRRKAYPYMKCIVCGKVFTMKWSTEPHHKMFCSRDCKIVYDKTDESTAKANYGFFKTKKSISEYEYPFRVTIGTKGLASLNISTSEMG